MGEIVNFKTGGFNRLKLFLALLMSFYLVGAPVFAHVPDLPQDRDRIEIKGVVKDPQGETVIGATIRSKSNKFAGATTGVNGDFTIFVSSMDDVLIFNYVGMEQKEVPLKAGTTTYNVVMEVSKATQIKDVVVEAGIMQYDPLAFAGSVTRVSRQELKQVGNVNILQNLKMYDPSFHILENHTFGSNPNVMATIEIRGQNTMNLTTVQDEANLNPNAPLFILDGFEATMEEVNDLNVNMIESITILKDAGSTAIYGAKGGNGVVVIETIKPEGGRVFVRYDGSFQLSAPDLTVYNMMNAAEKLEFERLAGRYGNISQTEGLDGDDATLYYERLKRIESGLDTYWMSEPVRTGVTQTHSVNVTGGDKRLLFLAGFTYNNIQGVMKTSDRESFTGKMGVTYRPSSKFIAQNTMSMQGINSNDGAFSNVFQTFANASPYLNKRNEDGSIPRIAEEYRLSNGVTYVTYNPLYNANLNSKNDGRTFYVRNNTSLDWFITDDLRLKGSLGLYRESFTREKFTDPAHTQYADMDYTKQGQYGSTHSTKWSYDGSVSIIYNKVFNGHNVTFNGRISLKESNYTSESIIAEGFPIGAPLYPEFAYSYKENSQPSYSKTKSRDVSFVGALTYNYNYRYLLNLTINREGSNNFGSKNKFATFGSVGLGWNLHKESFLENVEWLNYFKLKGTYGTNAIQSKNAITSSVYKYNTGYNVFGLGAYLSDFGNPYFEWEKVKKTSVGLESQFLDNRVGLRFDVFKQQTNPQAVNLPVRSSSGMTNYWVNMGRIYSKGFEFFLTVNPIKDLERRIFLNLTLNGSHVRAKYDGFENALSQLNEQFLNVEDNVISNMQKYEDGRSPRDLWAVRSLGIDPATGRELFLTKDEEVVYRYNSADRVVVGNTEPDLKGAFMINFTYNKLKLNMGLYYSLGADRLNNALYEKVENINNGRIMNNLDKRALYDRWQKPGDVAQFKAISQTSSTRISSRFVQKDTYLQGTSFQVGWDFSNDRWIKNIGMQELTITANMNDIFTWSTIKVERATEYPFQRSFSINLATRF